MKFLSRVISTILASTMLCGISISANAMEINENEIINQEQSTEISTEQPKTVEQPTETNLNAFSHFEQSTENPSQAETDTPPIFKPEKDVVVESNATTWQSAYISYVNDKTSTYPDSVYRLIDIDKNGIPELFHDTHIGLAGQYVVGFYNGNSKIVHLGCDGLVYYSGNKILSCSGRQGYYYDDCYTVTSSNITKVWAGECHIPYYVYNEEDGDYYIINISTGSKRYVLYDDYYTSLFNVFNVSSYTCVNETTSYNKSQIINKINQTPSGVTSVKLNKTSITLGVGESYTLTKTITPSNVSTSYSWLTSKSSVATVSSTGKITAKAVGTSTITVKTSNGKTATCTVTVKNAPSSVSLNKTSLTLGVGEQFDLNSSLPSGTAAYSITYSSNNSSVASVTTAGGMVTAKKVGTATITARTYNGKTVNCYVTVKNVPSSISLNKTSLTLGVGESYTLIKTITPSNASANCSWLTSKSSVATVSSIGKITAKAVGTSTITVKTSNGKTATCTVTVKNAPSSVSLNKTSLTLGIGEQFDLNSSLPSGTAAYSITYSSNNSSVASVTSAGGMVTAKKVGTATITAKTYNGKTVNCYVTIKNAPSSVSLNKTSLTLGVGEQFDLNSSLPSGTAAYSIVYSSNKSSVASVAAAGGMVTAKSVGYATVTARTYNGKTVNCYITVKKAPSQIYIDSPYIYYENEKLTLLVGEKFDFNSRLNDGAAAYHISYSSSNSNVCSVVSAGGLATAKSAGTATIKATTYNGKTVTCTVVVKSSIPSKRVYLRDFSILVPDRCVYSSSNTGISIYDKYNYNNFGWQYGFYGNLTSIGSHSHFESSDHPGFMKNLGYANGNYYVQLRPTDVQWCCDSRFTVSQQNEARKQYQESYSYMYYIVDSIRWY